MDIVLRRLRFFDQSLFRLKSVVQSEYCGQLSPFYPSFFRAKRTLNRRA